MQAKKHLHARRKNPGKMPSWLPFLVAGTYLGSSVFPAHAQASIDGGATVSVPGSQASPWNIGGTLAIGDASSGTLNISAGATVTNTSALLGGLLPSSIGTVNVSDLSTSWINSGALSVGIYGSGTINILDGGGVAATMAGLGAYPDSVGVIVVDGEPSVLTITNELIVGDLGQGFLVIRNRGWVRNTDGYVGFSPSNGTSSVIVTGGSLWDNQGALSVGHYGSGQLDILQAANVHAGSLSIGSGSPAASGMVNIDGTGSFLDVAGSAQVGQNGHGVLILGNGGTIRVANGAGTLSVGMASTGSGEVVIGGVLSPVAPGTLEVSDLELGDHGQATLLLNHTSSAYLLPASITGTGTIYQRAGHTTFTGNSGAFTGTTAIEGGTLAVNGFLGGTLNVLAGGRLQGNGTAGHVAVTGAVAPGNSIGTLSVAGNLVFNPGSTYEAEVNAAGQSDLISVAGSTSINGGTVNVLAASGIYGPSTQYTILTSAGGISGTFSSVTSNYAFLNPSLTYDASHVYLTLASNGVSFAGIGGTPNQIAAGNGVEALGAGNSVYDAAISLSVPQARHAFDQLSGEIHASMRTALNEEGQLIRSAMNSRLRAAFDTTLASRPLLAAYDGSQAKHMGTAAADAVLWGQASSSQGRSGSDGNAARLDRTARGLLLGVDQVFEAWRIGLVAGYTRTEARAPDRASSGYSDSYHLGMYGGTHWGPWSLRSGGTYTRHKLSTHRAPAFPGHADSLRADYSARTLQVFGELGYEANIAGLQVEPFAGIAYAALRNHAFSETGGAAALSATAEAGDIFMTTLGARTASRIDVEGAEASINTMVGWRHASGETAPFSTMRFATGTAFEIAGTSLTRNTLVVEAGLDLALSQKRTVGISYGGQFGKRLSDHMLRIKFDMKF